MTTLKTTALRPLFLAVLVAAIIGGVTVVWWLLPLGLLVYAASVLLAARDPQTITAAERSAVVVERSVARAQLTSPTFRAVIDEIASRARSAARWKKRAVRCSMRCSGPPRKPTSLWAKRTNWRRKAR